MENNRNQIALPRIIHFVWAGGTYYMPENSLAVVKQWKKANPEFKIFIWIDKESDGSINNQILYYANELAEKDEDKSTEIEACKTYLESQNIYLKCISEEEVEDDYSRYEIDRLRPNYGASSDLLRYSILYKFGGAYFDSDVPPGEKSLSDSDLFHGNYDDHRLYVDANSQNQGHIGNDAFICTKHNPAMKAIYEQAKSNYALCTESEDMRWYTRLPSILYRYDECDEKPDNYILCSTPLKTGPDCVRVVIKDADIVDAAISENSLTKTDQGNHREWVNKRLKVQPDFQECVDSIRKTMAFEAEKMKIFRLDDHISNLSAATGATTDEAAAAIIKLANQLEFKDIEGIQLTYQFSESIVFVSNNTLLEKTYLFPLSKACETLADNREYFQISVQIIFERLIHNLNKCSKYKNAQQFKNFLIDNFKQFIIHARMWVNNKINSIQNEKEQNNLVNFIDSVCEFLKNQILNSLAAENDLEQLKDEIKKAQLPKTSKYQPEFHKKTVSSNHKHFSEASSSNDGVDIRDEEKMPLIIDEESNADSCFRCFPCFK